MQPGTENRPTEQLPTDRPTENRPTERTEKRLNTADLVPDAARAGAPVPRATQASTPAVDPDQRTPGDRDKSAPTDTARTDGARADTAPTDTVPTDAVSTDAMAARTHAAPPTDSRPSDDTAAELFTSDEVTRFRGQWQTIQTNFVDDPQEAVQGADHLVAEVMQTLAATFADHKRDLEGQWRSGAEVETEDLRVALRRYRSFLNQLLDA